MIRDVPLNAYRWLCIATGAQEQWFAEALGSVTTRAHMDRIGSALAPIFAYACS